MQNNCTFRWTPLSITVASPQSTWASSPGAKYNGTKTSPFPVFCEATYRRTLLAEPA